MIVWSGFAGKPTTPPQQKHKEIWFSLTIRLLESTKAHTVKQRWCNILVFSNGFIVFHNHINEWRGIQRGTFQIKLNNLKWQNQVLVIHILDELI